MKFTRLIAVALALTTLRWHARPHLWRAAFVAALCAPLAGVMPTARSMELSYPAFTEVINVSANPGNSNYPQIAGKDGALFTVWMDGGNILYRRLKIVDGKANPDPTVNITNFGPNENAATSPQIATDPLGGDNNVYVAWTQTRDGHIWFKRSSDGGVTFGSGINISKSPGTTFAPRIAVAGKFVFVAWGDFTDTGFADDDKPGCPGNGGSLNFDLSECRFSIYVAASEDGGQSFGAPVNVSGRPSANGVPGIAAAPFNDQGASVYVTWSGISRQAPWANIFLAHSNDSGRVWAYATECPGDAGKLSCSGWPQHPQVAASANGDVYVAWSERPVDGNPGDEDIYIVVGRNRGASFERGFNLSHSPGTSDYPELAISNSGVQVVWHDGTSGVMDAWYSRSIDGGKDFTERRNIGQTPYGFVYRPRVAASGDNVHMVWSDGFDVYYALSTDNGGFFDLYQLSTSHSDWNALHPRLAPNGSFISAAWDQGAREPLFDPLPRGERDIFVGATVVNRTDLVLSGLEAVQAPFGGKALAQGKPTLVRIEVQNDSPRKLKTNLKLVYETLLNGVVTTVTDIGPVELTPGVNKFFLPSDSFIWPDGTEFHASATIDPNNDFEEVDETNNTKSITVPIKDTGSLRVLYVPLSLYLDGRDAPTCEAVQRVMETAHMYLRAIYPIEPRRLKSEALCTKVFRAVEFTPLDTDKLHRVLYNLEGWAKMGMADIVIGVVPPGWFAANAEGSYAEDAVGLGRHGGHASIVEARLPESVGYTVAHEIAHNLGWVKSGFELEDKNHPNHLQELFADGYWVTQRREVKGMENMYWIEPAVDKWIITDSYDYLMNALIRLNARVDPKVIMIRGAIRKDNTTTLDPWYRTESLLDVPLGNPGDTTVIYLDGAGQVLGQTGFDLPSGVMPDAGATVDTIRFSQLIPDVPGTRKIVLKKGNLVLAERAATPNSPTVRVLTPNGGERFNPGDTVRVTWESADADGDALTHAVMFSRDAGQTWFPLELDVQGHELSFTASETDATKDARVKVIVTDGFNGAEDSSDAGFSIGGASHGLSFGHSEMLRDNVNSYPIMATARTAASGDNVYAVWSERTCQPGCSRADVFFGRSTDRGTSFEGLIKLSTNANPNETPYIAISGDTVYVVWNEDIGHIVMRRSIDGGATFGAITMLTTNGGFPQIAAAGDRVYVVWETSMPTSAPYPPTFQQFDVLFSASMDRGATFGAPVNLSDTGTRDSGRPQVVVAGRNVYVAWSEGGLGDNSLLGPYEIRVRRSIDGGTTFDPSVNLPGNGGRGTYGPGGTAYEIVDAIRLAAVGNNLYVAWRDYTDFRASIAFTRSTDAGATFSPVVALSSSSRSPWFAQLAVSAAQVYVAWSEGTDMNDGGTGMMDVLFRASANDGASFGPEMVLSTSQGRALFPHLVAQGDTVDMIWQHDRPSPGLPWEVVFRQSTDRGQSFAAATVLGTEQGQTGYPQLAVTPENVYATWLGYYGYPTNSRDYRYLAFRAGSIGVGGENRPPTANAGTDRTVTEGSIVALLGLGSDLDGDKLAFSWQQTGGPAMMLAEADTATPAFTAPVGSAGSTLTFQLTVDDGKLQSAPSEIRISIAQRPPITDLPKQAPWLIERNRWEDLVELSTPIVVGKPDQQDTTPPITSALLAGTLGSNGWYKAGDQVRLTLTASDVGSGVASTSYAINGGAMQNYSAPVVFTDGTYTVTYRSVDKAGNVESLKSISFKIDQTAPKFSMCAANPPVLWPPNHNMVDVTVSLVVTDDGSGPAAFVLKSTTSNEPDNGMGNGDTPNDIQGFEVGKPDTQGQLRAERSELGTGGRIYKLAYQAWDAAGNVQTCIVAVTVPHDQGSIAASGKTASAPTSQAQAAPQGGTSTNLVPPLVFQSAGPTPDSIRGTVAQFRAALGGLDNHDDAGPLPSGSREINWDGGMNDQTTTVAKTPFSGFEVIRGAVFTTPDGTGFVQAPPAADPVLFPPGGLAGLFNNQTYGTIFGTFSPQRLFSAIGSNITEVDFVVPGGGDIPATITGFGAIFTNVGQPDASGATQTRIEYYGVDGALLWSGNVPAWPSDRSLSFFGIVFNDARIGWVRITSGDAAPGQDDGGNHRIVVMDDFIYGEPQPLR